MTETEARCRLVIALTWDKWATHELNMDFKSGKTVCPQISLRGCTHAVRDEFFNYKKVTGVEPFIWL